MVKMNILFPAANNVNKSIKVWQWGNTCRNQTLHCLEHGINEANKQKNT